MEITDGDSFSYRGNIFYDLVKTSVIRLAFVQAYELRKRGIAAVAVTPGFLRSEAMLDRFGVTEKTWRDGGKKDANFLASETPGDSFVRRPGGGCAGGGCQSYEEVGPGLQFLGPVRRVWLRGCR